MNSPSGATSTGTSTQKHVEKFQTLLLLDFIHGFLQKNIKDPASTLEYYSDAACAGSLLGDKYFKKPFNSKDDLIKLLTTNEKVKNSYSQMRYCISNVERRASDNLIILQVQGVLFQVDQPLLGSRDFIRLFHFKHVKDDFFEITYDNISIVEVFKTTSLPTKDSSDDILSAEKEKLTKSISSIGADLTEQNGKLAALEEKLIMKKKQIEEKKKQMKTLNKEVMNFEAKTSADVPAAKPLAKETEAGAPVKKTTEASKELQQPSAPKSAPTLTDRTAEFSLAAASANSNKPKQSAVLMDKTANFKAPSSSTSQSPQLVSTKSKRNNNKDQSQKTNNKLGNSNNNSNNDLSQFATPASTPPPTTGSSNDKKDDSSKQQDNDKNKKDQQEDDDDDEWETVGKINNNKDSNRSKKSHQRNDSDSSGYKKKKNSGGDINKNKSGMTKKNY